MIEQQELQFQLNALNHDFGTGLNVMQLVLRELKQNVEEED